MEFKSDLIRRCEEEYFQGGVSRSFSGKEERKDRIVCLIPSNVNA